MDSKPIDIQQTRKQFDRHAKALMDTDSHLLQQHLKDFHRFMQDNDQLQSVLDPALIKSDLSSDKWWEEQSEKVDWESGQGTWQFPTDPDDMFRLQYELICDQANNRDPNFIEKQMKLTFNWSISNQEATRQLFLSKIVQPFTEDLRDSLNESGVGQRQEMREMKPDSNGDFAQEDNMRIFLSHKTENKERVRRYHNTLQALGYDPWLDDPEMPAGTELDRGILEGVKESCAMVFFITEEFTDEKFLADEINYAKNRKREQGDRFAVITLKFSASAEVPELLETYVWKNIDNDLDGLYEIIRALPIELGPVRWKESVAR